MTPSVSISKYAGGKQEETSSYKSYKGVLLDKSHKKILKLKNKIIQNPDKIKEMRQAIFKQNIDIDDEGNTTLFGKKILYWIEYLSNDQINTIKNLSILESNETVNKRIFLINIVGNIVNIWSEEALRIEGNLWLNGFDLWGISRDTFDIGGKIFDKKNHKKNADKNMLGNINKVILKYDKLYKNKLLLSEEDFKKEVDNIFDIMLDIETNAESVIGEDDLKEVNKVIFNDELDDYTKIVKVLDLMRYEGWDGNSKGVKEVLIQELLKKNENQDIINITEDKTFFTILNESGEAFELRRENALRSYWLNDTTSDNNRIKENKENATNKEFILTELLNKYSFGENSKKISEFLIKRYSSLVKEIKKRDKAGQLKILLDINAKREQEGKAQKTLKNLEKEQIIGAIKVLLLYIKTALKEKRYDKEDTIESIYADSHGLAQTEGILGLSDGFNLDDENIDEAIELGVNVGSGVLTLGSGTVVLFGAKGVGYLGGKVFIAGSSKLASGLKLGTAGRALGRTGEVIYSLSTYKVGNFTKEAILTGIGFYQGANLMSNALWKDVNDLESLFEGFDDFGNNLDSILFMGILGGTLKALTHIKGLKNFKSVNDKIPKELINNTLIKSIIKLSGLTGISSSIMGIGYIIEIINGREGDFSLKSLVELMFLLSVFHRITSLGKTKEKEDINIESTVE